MKLQGEWFRNRYREHRNSHFLQGNYIGRPLCHIEAYRLTLDDWNTEHRRRSLLEREFIEQNIGDNDVVDNGYTKASFNKLITSLLKKPPQIKSEELYQKYRKYILTCLIRANTELPQDVRREVDSLGLEEIQHDEQLNTERGVASLIGCKLVQCNNSSYEYSKIKWITKLQLEELGIVNKVDVPKIYSNLVK